MANSSSAVPSLLIVDDNHDAAELMGDVLAAVGYEVRIAFTGPDALQLLGEFTPDCALLDIGLPVMDGYELARTLRRDLPEICLVAVTAYGLESDRERSREAGFAAHLVKPVSIDNVIETLDDLLH